MNIRGISTVFHFRGLIWRLSRGREFVGRNFAEIIDPKG